MTLKSFMFFDTRTGDVLVDGDLIAEMLSSAGDGATASFTASMSVPPDGIPRLTVTAVASGVIVNGMTVHGSSVPLGTVVTGQLSGTPGSIGVYSLNQGAVLGSRSMTASNDLSINRDLNIAGTLLVGDAAVFNDDVEVAGDFTADGDLDVAGNTTLANLRLGTGTKTATAVAGAATLNSSAGVITTEPLTTAAGADYTLTLTNSKIAVGDQVFVSFANGTNSAGLPMQGTVVAGAGSATIVIHNMHASAALNGTLKITFFVLKN